MFVRTNLQSRPDEEDDDEEVGSNVGSLVNAIDVVLKTMFYIDYVASAMN